MWDRFNYVENPSYEDLVSEKCQSIYSFWQAQCDGQDLPDCSNLKPSDIAGFLSSVIMVDVEGGAMTDYRLMYRGDDVAEITADINITDNQKITGVAKAVSARQAALLAVTESADNTVATKEYVDQEIATDPVVFSMDITGLGTGTALQNAVAAYLNDLYPAVTLNTNKVARIHTTSYAGATVEGVDVKGAKNVSYIAVDSNGTQNASVVQDIAFAPEGASGVVILTPARTLMTYQSNGTSWDFVGTTAY